MVPKPNKRNKLSGFLKRFILWILILFFGSSVFFTILYKFIPPPVTPLMLIRLLDQRKNEKQLVLKKNWVSLKYVSGYMPAAVIACEDQNFLTHKGFDLKAIKKAQKHNSKSKKKRGASTISQQTAKNVFLWPKRSWFRKGLEVYFTILIEIIWGKKRIMEVYLNVIETGDGIYGVDKAAEIYFNKNAKNLTKREAALIAVCLPNPLKMKPNKLTGYRLKRLSWALRQINYFYPVEFNQIEISKNKDIPSHSKTKKTMRQEDPDPFDLKPEEFLESNETVVPGDVIEIISDSNSISKLDSVQ